MDVAPYAIVAFVVLFAAALRWATGGLKGSIATPTPEEPVGKSV
ncbi:MAG TPA: hypothetical protein VGD59_07385 [Acidisarcina sp.]